MRNRILTEWLFVSLLAIATVVTAQFVGLIARGDNLIYDSLIRFSQSSAPPAVVIVSIDEQSLSEIGSWPWPRATHAAMIRRLSAAAPRAIGYDVLFVEPTADDAALAGAMASSGRVLLPLAFQVPGPNGRAFQPEAPVPPIAAAVKGVGQAAVQFDEDGIVRRAALVAGSREAHWPHLAEMLYRAAYGHPSSAFARAGAGLSLPTGQLAMAEPVLLRFGALGQRFPTIPFAAVLAGEVPADVFRDRIVLVGNTAAGSGDQYPVPASGGTAAMPGVEILANVVEGLIHDDLIRPAGAVSQALFTLVPLALLLVALLRFPPRINLLIGASLIGGSLLVSAVLLRVANLWLPPTAGLTAVAIVYPLWAWRRLAATSAFMSRELTELSDEAGMLPGVLPREQAGWMLGDPVEQQTDLLRHAIGRVRDLRRFLADSLQSLPDATLILDEAGRVVIANQAAHDLFGRDCARPLTALLHDLSHQPSGDRPLEQLDGCEIVSREGRTFAIGVAPLASATSRQVGWIARLGDITAIRLATRQREEALQLLTHDMRSPQASILALLEQKGPSDRDVRIAAYARRTLGLADAYVQLARAESADYVEEVLDLGSLMVEAADDQWTLAHRRRIDIRTDAGGMEHLVCGDRLLLSRALVNLINNAVKHGPDGGVVACDVASPVPSPRSGDSRAMIVAHVRDAGGGIPPDQLADIFERFRTTDRRTHGSHGGAGLGLAFVRTVLERHGGFVEAGNAADGGAVFTLHLPLVDASGLDDGSA